MKPLLLALLCAVSIFAQGSYVPGGGATGSTGSTPIASVFGRTGVIAAQAADYDFSQLSGLITFAQFGQNGAASGQVPVWNGLAWVPSTISSGGGSVNSVFGRTGVIVATGGDYNFSLISGMLGLGQIAQGGAATGQYMSWSGSIWSPATMNYQRVQANTVNQTQRLSLNFGTDFAVTDSSGNNSTSVALAFKSFTVSAGAGLNGGGSANLGGMVTLSLPTSGVTPGVYGNASNVPQISVDAYGRITSAANVGIAGGTGGGGGSGTATAIATTTMSAIPATCTIGQVLYVADASLSAGGYYTYFCVATNTWAQSGYQAGGTGALVVTCSTLPCTVDINPAAVPLLPAANAWTGANDFSAAAKTAPFRIAASDPATCDSTVAEFFFNTATSKLKVCTALNTWTSIN